MAKLCSALVCERVIIDAATQLPIYLNHFNGIAVHPDTPEFIPMFRIVSNWHRDPNVEQTLRVRVVPVDPKGNERLDAQSENSLTSDRPFHRWDAGLPKWRLDQEGLWTLRFDVWAAEGWSEAGSIPFDFARLPPSGPTPTQSS